MATTTVAPTLVREGGSFQSNWIISRRDDLVWFIGSALISYLALALMAAGFPVTPLFLIWVVGVDGPHVVATITRTYFDKQERARLGWLLWTIVPFALVGPVMLWLGHVALFYLFAVCWQHFHIAKQHYGMMMLWKAKNKDRDPLDMKLDRWFMLTSTVLPLALFVLKTQPAVSRLADWIIVPALTAYALFAAIYIGRQIRKFQSGTALNTPKLLLLAILVPLQWLAFWYASGFGPDGVLRAGIMLGLFHSFQYHRLLWFHNRNRYRGAGATEKYGWASFFAKDLGYYLVLAIGLNLLFSMVSMAVFPTAELAKTALCALGFTHYFLDSKIWRVRGDKELAVSLRLN